MYFGTFDASSSGRRSPTPTVQTPRTTPSGRLPASNAISLVTRPVRDVGGVGTRVATHEEGTTTACERRPVSADLLERARVGDGDAFRTLTEPHRRELQVHCYRMLGSLQDAEDAVQDTLLAAWRGIGSFEGRSSLRTWLYRLATNRCLNVRRAASRHPQRAWPIPGVDPIEPSRLGEITWLEPFPDALLDGVPGHALGPEARYEASEAISLAFITALQFLPPRQRAVLVLRDVLGFHAREVADTLETTVESVTSALKRARATLGQRLARSPRDRTPAPRSHDEAELVARLTDAYATGDVGSVIALLTDDVVVAMPPLPLEYHGLGLAHRFHADVVFRNGRTYRLVATRANGQPAFGAYVRDPAGGPSHALGLLTFTLAGDRIRAITRFDTIVLPYFGLPRVLPA
jgi:RNA polymerase sigma-70 factor (ECF subfamily)